MNSSTKTESPPAPVEQIVAHGGWIEGEARLGRPKTRLYTMAALLWIFPSGGALFLLAPGARGWLSGEKLSRQTPLNARAKLCWIW